jgi:hypothetical protein
LEKVDGKVCAVKRKSGREAEEAEEAEEEEDN